MKGETVKSGKEIKVIFLCKKVGSVGKKNVIAHYSQVCIQ